MDSVWMRKGFSAAIFASLGLFLCCLPPAWVVRAQDPISAKIESARRILNESQLQSLKNQFEQQLAQNSNDAEGYFQLARVEGYLVDVFEDRHDKKSAEKAVDDGIRAVHRSIQLNDKSADAHSLLADLYGRKISFGGAFAGPRLGPKIGDENKRAMALDEKNPHVWASTGRQYLMAPKMFGGDTGKAVESFQKSLQLDPTQDETWVWLAMAFGKQGEKVKAKDAVERALALNPQSPFAKAQLAKMKE